jgi:hypothetical protein
MNLKPPITRTRGSGWLGRSTRLKSLAVVGALTLGCAGAAIVAAGPASADPAVSFVEVGSDTTQFVMDQFAATVGGAILGSYDAVNPLSQVMNETITPQIVSPTVAGQYSSCSFTRPNGSGGGFKAMDYAYTVGNGTTILGQNGTPPESGCIQLSRSSSAPGSVTSGTCDGAGSICSTGNFVYVPYAADAVTYATGPTSVTTTAYAFTATMGSPAVFTASGSAYANTNTVNLTGTGLPGGFSATNSSGAIQTYYVVDASGDTFELASSFNGTPIDSTSAGSGTVQFVTTTLCQSTTTGCTNGDITFNPSGTNIPQGMDLTIAQLQTLYASCQSLTVAGTTLNPGTSYTMTAPVASPAIFTTATTNALTAEEEVTLQGTLSTGLSSQTVYYVINPGTNGANTFELATTPTGTAIGTTGTTATAGSVATIGNVDLYAPQPGSGTLAFWELSMGVSAPQSCWRQVVLTGPAAGIAVEEHDGSVLDSDANGIVPMSIGRWVSGSTGVTPDLRHGAVLQAVTAVSTATPPVDTVVQPLNSGGTINLGGCTATGFSQSACFPLQRELYNVMDYYEIVSGSTPPSGTTNNPAFNAVLSGLFDGSASTMCRSSFTISANGFEPLFSGSTFTDLCGASTASLRVQMNNSSANG